MKGEGGPAGGAAASTVRVAAKLTKRVDAARVGVPGLRKTVATLDAALSPTEIDEVSWTESWWAIGCVHLPSCGCRVHGGCTLH